MITLSCKNFFLSCCLVDVDDGKVCSGCSSSGRRCLVDVDDGKVCSGCSSSGRRCLVDVDDGKVCSGCSSSGRRCFPYIVEFELRFETVVVLVDPLIVFGVDEIDVRHQ